MSYCLRRAQAKNESCSNSFPLEQCFRGNSLNPPPPLFPAGSFLRRAYPREHHAATVTLYKFYSRLSKAPELGTPSHLNKSEVSASPNKKLFPELQRRRGTVSKERFAF